MKKLSLSVKVNSHLQPAGLGVSYWRETHIVQNPDSPICTTEKERFELQRGKTVYPIEISTATPCIKCVFFFFFFETCHSARVVAQMFNLIVSLDILYFSFLGEIEYLRVPLESLSYQQVYSEDNKCSIVLHSSRKKGFVSLLSCFSTLGNMFSHQCFLFLTFIGC